jgi:caffeoyl-CoA O-methyltransferase
MDIIHPDLQRYSEEHCRPESKLLKKIHRETMAHVLMPRMLSGHLQGRVLSMISRMIRPRLILEIGTYTGYSAICLAEGLHPDGRLITIDVNEELEDRVRSYFKDADLTKKVEYHIGRAVDILPGLQGPFDLVFIDADKQNNPVYFDLVIDKVPVGGFILADNVLWNGKVVQSNPDKDTRNVLAFNEKIQQDDRVENVLLPVRDGIMVMQKVRA